MWCNQTIGDDMDAYLRTKEAATQLGISSRTLLDYVKKGKIKSYKPGGKLVYFLKSDLDAFVKNDPTPREQM